MTVTTTQTLLSNVVYGQASGNYDGSSLDWYGNAVPAANYYNGLGNIQTIFFDLEGFVGVITVQATLNEIPTAAQWFDISERGDGTTPDTEYSGSTVTGNFVWLRARVEGFDAGTIKAVSAVY